MGAGGARCWPIEAAWGEAVRTVAAAYGVDVDLLTAASRGRGPRPPERAREPKKMAVHLAVRLSGASYADVGRAIGLHKDTVTSHCHDVREAILAEDAPELAADALERLARARLALVERDKLSAIRAHLALLEETAAEMLHPSFIRHLIRREPENHENVIALPSARGAA